MCLGTVLKRGLNESGVGYKVLEKRNGKLYSPTVDTSKVRPVGKWLRASLWFMPRWLRWSAGWYICLDAEGALDFLYPYPNMAIFKVEYKNGHTRGCYYNPDRHTIVASRMRIIEEVRIVKSTTNSAT
jgi:hypothetical protein